MQRMRCRSGLSRIAVLSLLTVAGARGDEAPPVSVEREVRFEGAEGVKLAGTLLIPARESEDRVPGVILVAGSGPTDRNGNASGLEINLLRQVAEALAAEGLVSLRYDKRGVGASDPPPKDDSLPAFAVWENFVRDAAAALDCLQQQPEVDPRRTAMIGHSEGGMLILQAAVEGVGFEHPPAALVLISTPGRRGDEVLRQQIGRNPVNAILLSQANDDIMERIRETGQVPDDVTPLLAPLYPRYLGKYWQSVLNFEGAAWASRFPGPVLVIAGENDVQVLAEVETVALSDALKQRESDEHEVFVVPGASHNLKPVAIFFDPGFAGDIAPEAASKLRSWLSTTLGRTAN